MQNELASKTKEVAEKTTLDMARKMKQEGASLDFISNVTVLSFEVIGEL